MSKSKSIYNETRGVSYDDFYNTGKVRNTLATADEQRGTPVPASHAMRSNDVRHDCVGITKKGTVCKARPVGGTSLCAGHTKAVNASGPDGDNGSGTPSN